MSERLKILNPKDFDALLVDLDGVMTKTATVHATAWKQLFDEFLEKRADSTNESFEPFDRDRDYRMYVDGLPRYKGVETFLQSRGISLPYGSPDDDPKHETICGLGNKKNSYFLEQLHIDGVKLYEPAVAFLRKAHSKGLKCAVVSSSKNCQSVLEEAGLTNLFEAQVDGLEITRLGLQGKPNPDMFLEAATRLGVKPERAIVVEDAVSGVEAGRSGGFGLVIGVNRSHRAGMLKDHGADWEVSDFTAVTIESTENLEGEDRVRKIPSALEHMEDIAQKIQGKRLAVFLDYDGTLTPIVDRPELAILSEKMRETIQHLTQQCPVAIVSGRDRSDVQKLVHLNTVVYAGSHGFDISGPENLFLRHEEGCKSWPALRAAGNELDQQLRALNGLKVEHKTFAVAVHFRLVEASLVPKIRKIVEKVAEQYPELRITGGKKIFELRPAIDWGKGKAVEWLLGSLALGEGTVPIYIGDDETDEDAFHVLKMRGIGILVTQVSRSTEAQYGLKDPEEVKRFLTALIADLQTRDL